MQERPAAPSLSGFILQPFALPFMLLFVACTRLPGSFLFTERPPPTLSLTGGQIRSLAGPVLIYRLQRADRLGRASYGREGNQGQIREAVLGPLHVETHHLNQALDGGRFDFLSGRSCTVTRSVEEKNPDSR